MIARRRFALIALLSLTAASCGLKGPLYRSEDTAAEPVAPASEPAGTDKRPATAYPAPQSQKEERKKAGENSEQSASPPDPDRPAVPPRP